MLQGMKMLRLFYRVTVFIPALNAINLDMTDRFSMQQKAAFTLAFLLPNNVISDPTTWEFVKPAFDKYIDVLRCELPNISEELLQVEVRVWAAMCRRQPPKANEVSSISAVNMCPP